MVPYKCPVCSGRGIVPSGFYNVYIPIVVIGSTTNVTETCKSCHGSGIVYGYGGVVDTPVWSDEIKDPPDPITANYSITWDGTWIDGAIF